MKTPAEFPHDRARTPWAHRLAEALAVMLPLSVALTRAASSGQWRDDLPAVRDQGLVAVGFGGALSTVATQALGLVPLGPRPFRAALGSVLALGLATWLLFRLTTRVLAVARGFPNRPVPALASAVAAVAALTAALSPTWQREGTVGGGAMIGTACALAALEVVFECRASSTGSSQGAAARPWIGLAALLAATLCESPPAGAALLPAVALALAGKGWRVPFGSPRIRNAAMVVAAGCALLLLSPLVLRPLAPRALLDLGHALSIAGLAGLDAPSARTTAIAAWTREIGVVSLAVAAGGAALGIFRSRTRPYVGALAALILVDVVFPARIAGVLAVDPLTAVRSLAVAAISVGSALGVCGAATWLGAQRVPLARSAAVLVVVFHVTLVALTSEEAGLVADRSRQSAAEAWADAALGNIEPRAAILVRSPAIAWRLWAARVTRGERPDVVVIPAPLLGRGRVATSLMSVEPSLQWLLRDFRMTGEPSEFALSKVADARTLYVELDPAWSKRLLNHLTVAGLWLQYAPEPLGPSDRRLAVVATLGPVRRVIAAISGSDVPDPSTASVLSDSVRSHADVLTMLGERETAFAFQSAVAGLVKSDPLASSGVLRAAIDIEGLAALTSVAAPPPPEGSARPPHGRAQASRAPR